MSFILSGKLNERAVNISRKFSLRSPQRAPRLGVSILQKTEDLETVEARSDAASSSYSPGHLIRADLWGQRSLPFCNPRSFSFASIRVHSRFENLCKSRRCGAASPYQQKRQDFKRQDSREEAGSPSFTPMPPITHNISTFLFCVP
jgi:hypothetical protein